ncbi:MAG: SDR family oxidoreductase [Deltaproteobacteria bacterium]|nr:SDR family oxidoreductase [Deltaproteobacteria bacterium]
MSPYSDAVCIVTGGASGIGRALGAALDRRGARVTLADRDVDGLARVGAALHGITTARVDVTDRGAVERLVQDVVEREGRIDYLFNNAGIGIGGEVRDHTDDDWRRVIDVNLHGIVHGVAAAYPVMVAQGHGHIVNTGSVAGLIPLPGEASYVASKYAVVGLSRTLRAEAAGLGVRVSVVCPGKIETSIWQTSRIVGFERGAVLDLLPPGITPERCAEIVLRGVARNRAVIVVTRTARALWMLERLSPSLVDWAARRYMARMRRHRL